MGLTKWCVKSEEFQYLSPYESCTQRRIKSLMLWVLWLLANRFVILKVPRHLVVFIVSHEINRMPGLMATWTFVAV